MGFCGEERDRRYSRYGCGGIGVGGQGLRTRERERERESPRRRRVDILLSFLLFDLTDMTRESPLEPRTTGLLLTTTP